MLALLLVATTAVSPRGAVAASHPLASEAGASVLRRGGNAVDAAVAAAFALGVVEPQSSGIGGGGFALVFRAKDKQVFAMDFREIAPSRATPDMYLENGHARQDLANAGPLSVAVPSAVRGYADLARRFGKLPLAQLVSPAQQIAERGFQTDGSFARASRFRLECLAADAEAARIFLRKDASGELAAYEPGEVLRQPDLARTLALIGLRGPDGFYRGRVGRSIVETVKAGGGILEAADFDKVKTRERVPLEGSYRGHRVVSMPLPSAGGVLVIALLQVLEGEDARAGGYRPERFLHVMIEAERRLFAIRQGLGDPAFNPGDEDRVRKMITKDFAATIRAGIGERATPSAQLPVSPEHGTTNISVIDEEGNAVALTTTVNDAFGACVVARGTGVVLNDQMDDFAVAPGIPNAYGLMGGRENAPGPGKVPLSSMSPTLMFDPSGALELSIGAAGGATIPTTVAQAISHVVDDGMPIDRAIAQPRIHHNLYPDRVNVEPAGLEQATARALLARGHVLHEGAEPGKEEEASLFASAWGKACAVQIDPDTGWRAAATDPRTHGAGAVP